MLWTDKFYYTIYTNIPDCF